MDECKPLARGELQCIGATTIDEYRKHIEKDPALERRFQPVQVPEPTVDETIQILGGLRERYEAHHKLRYTDEALEAGAHTCSLLSSSRTVSVTRKHPKHPRTPPQHGLHNHYRHPLSHTKRSS